MSIEYDKLVRDHIPERIESEGERPITHVADDQEYADRLAAKLVEEATEFEESRTLEELADVVAVVDAILEARDRPPEALERERRKKRAERGGFDDRLVLDRVEDT